MAERASLRKRYALTVNDLIYLKEKVADVVIVFAGGERHRSRRFRHAAAASCQLSCHLRRHRRRSSR
jgi:hypothetical protein